MQPLSSQLSLLAKLQIAVGSGIDCLVGPGVGRGVGLGVGSGVGSGVGFGVLGSGVGTGVGSGVGTSVGSVVGSRVGSGVGSAVGSGVGSGVGDRVGSGVGSGVSSGVGNDVGSGVFWRWSRCCLWSRFRRCLQGRRCFSGNIRFGVVVTSKEAFASETSLLPELEVTSGGDAVASAVLAVYSILVVSTRQSTTPSPSLSTKDPSYSPK